MEEGCEYPDLAVPLLLDEAEFLEAGEVALDAGVVESAASAYFAYVEVSAFGEDFEDADSASAAEEVFGGASLPTQGF